MKPITPFGISLVIFIALIGFALIWQGIAPLIGEKKSTKRKNKINSLEHNFMKACHAGDFKIIQKLLEEGVDINHQDKNGYTILMRATLHNNIKLVELLLKNGAALLIENKDGYTALEIAESESDMKIVGLLLAHSLFPDE